MKRWLSAVLVLALLCPGLPGMALAEPVEDEVPEAASTLALEGTGLTLEQDDTEDVPPPVEETLPPESADNPETFGARYARVTVESAGVYADAGSDAPFASVETGGTLLVLESSGSRAKVAFFTSEVIVEGWTDAAALVELSDAEIEEYMNLAASGIAVALYNDDLDRPLAPVRCTFAAPKPAATAELTPEPTAEPTPEPTAEPTPEPTAEPTPEPTAEPTPEPTATPTAKPTATPTAKPTATPTAKPTATPTAKPTATPTAKPTPTPTAEPETAIMAAALDGTAEGEVSDADETAEAALAAVAPAATSISLSASAIVIGLRETYTGLRVEAAPQGSALPEITWRTGNKKIVRVNAQGHVYGVKKGSAYIYAKMAGGKEVRCKVTVKKAPKKVYVSPAKLEMSAGGMTAQLKTAVTKKSASATITFESSDPAVAAVSDTGLVTALKAGTATITVKSFNGKKAACKVTVHAAPAKVAFQESRCTIGLGQKLALQAVAQDAGGGAVPAGIVYAIGQGTNTPDCVKLDARTGEVTGAKKGQVIISATTHNGVEGRCIVNVVDAPVGIALNQSSAVIGQKETWSGLTAALTAPAGENTCAAGITWTTSNRKVVRVSANGQIYGVKKGTATITATTHNGKKAKCKVTVRKAPKKVYVSPAKLEMSAGGMLYQLKTAVTKKTASAAITFESSDPAVVSVDAGGLLTAQKAGTATITVKSFNGKKATCKVTVQAAPTQVTFPVSSCKIGVGQKLTLQATARNSGDSPVPANITYGLDQANGSQGCVSVDPVTGAIAGLGKGVAIVTATTHNGVVCRCTVNVLAAPAGVTLNASSLSIGKKLIYSDLTATLTPPAGENECAGSITWSTSNKKVLRVNDKGELYGVKTGTAYVYATAYNGKKARCKVKVTKKPSPSQKLDYLLYVAHAKLGKPYVYGANGPDKFDCSGFTQYCFKQIGITLERSSYKQGNDKRYAKIKDPAQLKAGDVIFFDTNETDGVSSINHAALYLGNGYFVHASTGTSARTKATPNGSVIVSQFTNFYKRTFWWGYRPLG